jgi:hypothetical protein
MEKRENLQQQQGLTAELKKESFLPTQLAARRPIFASAVPPSLAGADASEVSHSSHALSLAMQKTASMRNVTTEQHEHMLKRAQKDRTSRLLTSALHALMALCSGYDAGSSQRKAIAIDLHALELMLRITRVGLRTQPHAHTMRSSRVAQPTPARSDESCARSRAPGAFQRCVPLRSDGRAAAGAAFALVVDVQRLCDHEPCLHPRICPREGETYAHATATRDTRHARIADCALARLGWCFVGMMTRWAGRRRSHLRALDHVAFRQREFLDASNVPQFTGRETRAASRLRLGSEQFDVLMQRLRKHPEDLQTAAIAADALQAIAMFIPEVLHRLCHRPPLTVSTPKAHASSLGALLRPRRPGSPSSRVACLARALLIKKITEEAIALHPLYQPLLIAADLVNAGTLSLQVE